jgi:hypothetical protein
MSYDERLLREFIKDSLHTLDERFEATSLRSPYMYGRWRYPTYQQTFGFPRASSESPVLRALGFAKPVEDLWHNMFGRSETERRVGADGTVWEHSVNDGSGFINLDGLLGRAASPLGAPISNIANALVGKVTTTYSSAWRSDSNIAKRFLEWFPGTSWIGGLMTTDPSSFHTKLNRFGSSGVRVGRSVGAVNEIMLLEQDSIEEITVAVREGISSDLDTIVSEMQAVLRHSDLAGLTDAFMEFIGATASQQISEIQDLIDDLGVDEEGVPRELAQALRTDALPEFFKQLILEIKSSVMEYFNGTPLESTVSTLFDDASQRI